MQLAITPATNRVETADILSLDDTQFLLELGQRVRALRDGRGMSRKLLARASSVSERYLGQLEAGEGNISIMLLRRVAAALSVDPTALLSSGEEESVARRSLRRLLEALPEQRIEAVLSRLLRELQPDEALRRNRIALVGLRGAGKSTLGAMLAATLQIPLVELNREVAREMGLPVSEVIALYGQTGYRRIERKVFERVLDEHQRAVIVAGGGIVADEQAYRLLLANCYTVWLRASPEDHMTRVLAQGDLRPMAGNEEAMDDLRRILEAREPQYGKADAIVDTAGAAPQASLRRLLEVVQA